MKEKNTVQPALTAEVLSLLTFQLSILKAYGKNLQSIIAAKTADAVVYSIGESTAEHCITINAEA